LLTALNRWLYWLAALVLASAAAALTIGLHQTRPSGALLVLDEARFIAGHSHTPPLASTGQPVALPDDWRQRAGQAATGWYLFDLTLDVAPNRLWSIYIPPLEMTPAAFVNGVLIGGDPKPTQPLDRYWNRPVLYALPNGLLEPGLNRVAIRLAANGDWGRLSELYLGPQESLLAAYEQRYFWRVTFLNITTVGSLMLALFMLALGLARRDSTYSWFAAFTFSWYLQNLFFLKVEVPYANYLWDFTAYVVIGTMTATYSMFTFRFLGLRRPRWERFIKTAVLTGPLVLLPLLLVSKPMFNLAGSLIWIAILLLLAIYPAFLITRRLLQQQNTELFLLTSCFALTLILGTHDWLVTSGLGYRHNGMLMQFAAAPTLATFGAILLRRFIAALRETESLNRDLELRVEEKAREIEASYSRTRELEAAQLLSHERERIMRDMHDGVGSQLIGMMAQLDRDQERDGRLVVEVETALRDLRLMIDSLDEVDNDVTVALGLFSRAIKGGPLSVPLLALAIGAAAGPQGLGWLASDEWPGQRTILQEAARLTLAISVMGIAIRSPARDLLRLLRPVAVLLTLGMLVMWLVSAGLAWAALGLAPLAALTLGAAVTPTDPVVASAIVTGEPAESLLPDRVRTSLSLESGANDGLGYLIVLLPLLLLTRGAAGETWAHFLRDVLALGILGAIAFGLALGLGVGLLMRASGRFRLMEPHSLLSLSVALSLLAVAGAHLIGSDGILASFAAGIGLKQVAATIRTALK